MLAILFVLYMTVLSCAVASSQLANSNLPETRNVGETLDKRTKFEKAFDESIRHITNGPKAWAAFTSGGRFRLAGAQDFSFPVTLCKKDPNCMEWHSNLPIVDSEIDNDLEVGRVENDFAAIVVDTSISNKDRFGVVIFNAPKDANAIPAAHWLLRERDLSKAILGYSRDGLSVQIYNDNETSRTCYARWNKATQEYRCEFVNQD